MAANKDNNRDLDSGAKRAGQVNEAMLNVPWYADDSLFFVIRYSERVRARLREVDFNEFTSTLNEAARVAETPPGELGGVTVRYERIAELKAKALAMVQDYPDLVQEFEQFLATSRSVKKMTGSRLGET